MTSLGFASILPYITLAFVISFLTVYLLSKQRNKLSIMDHPNERSLHSMPVNRTGGIGILFSILLALVLFIYANGMTPQLLPIALGSLLIAAISFLDDLFDLSVKVRLFFQMLAAIALIMQGLVIASVDLPFIFYELPNWLSYILTFLLVIWGVNLYNFMDGMDGFAGGMAIIGFGTFAVLGWLQGEVAFAVFSGCIASASAGFLVFNFPPAKIFMGDVGSSLLGFLMASVMIWADNVHIAPIWLGILVFSPFIFDATYTLLKRLFRGEKIWQAHRSHIYQQLVLKGWSHRRTVLAEYFTMLFCAALVFIAVTFSYNTVQVGTFFVSILFYAAIFFGVSRILKN